MNTKNIEWTKVPNERNLFMTKASRGLLFKDTKHKEFGYYVGRGDLSGGCDNWGPLKVDFHDLDAALNECVRMDRMLENAGWFNLKPDNQLAWDHNEMQMCLKNIEKEYIPDYLLKK